MRPEFSLVMWVRDLNIQHYRDALESLVQQTFDDFELYVLDDDGTGVAGMLAKEFFPGNDRIHVRELKNHKGGAYAYNVGVHFCEGKNIVFIGCHDRLSSETLRLLHEEYQRQDRKGIIYTDHDEIVGMDRMNPHFKEHFNKALLLRTPYIGDFICVSEEIFKKNISFNEKLESAYVYEFLLRCMHNGVAFHHIPSLLYHKRTRNGLLTKEIRRANTKKYKEHFNVAKAYLNHIDGQAQLEADPGERFWRIEYDSTGFEKNSKDYIYIRDEEVRVLNRRAAEKMYSYIKQKDVAVVGIRFLGQAFTVDNIGFFHDENADVYPAFHGHKIYRESYDNLSILPRDVSMVDPGCCMIDNRCYRKLGGFDPLLNSRDAMLDFCIRAREKGMRTIVLPFLSARYRVKNIESNEDSKNRLIEKHAAIFQNKDPFYNTNLHVGINNYKLPGEIDEETIAANNEEVKRRIEQINSESGSMTGAHQLFHGPLENYNGLSDLTDVVGNPLNTLPSSNETKTDLKM